MTTEPSALARPASSKDLFVTFTLLALQGFGGVLAIAQRVLVEQKRWLSQEEFIELLAVAQVMPGPNICNLALMIGDRFLGWRGAFAALGGMMAVPLVIVLILTAMYTQFASHPAVAGALKGMGAVSAGLFVGTGLKLAGALRSNPMGASICTGFAAVCFVAVALLHWPLVWVLLILGAIACLWAFKRLPSRAAPER